MVQLPGSNCFHLLTPAPRPGGSLAPGFQLQSGGPQEEPRSRRGRERPAFLCQRSSREVGRRGRNPRPADPKCPGQVAATGVQLLATAHPFHGCPPGVRREPGPFLHDQRATRRSTAQTGSLGQLERRRTSTNKCLFHMVNQSNLCCSKWESL